MRIPLTTDIFVEIDDCDAHIVAPYKWTVLRVRNNTYAKSHVGGATILMHRLIFGAKKGQLVDHEDGNGLNNRRVNLRSCTHAENMRNRRWNPMVKRPSKGVDIEKNGCYSARITHNGKRIYLGTFTTLSEASKAYSKSAKHLHGSFAKTG